MSDNISWPTLAVILAAGQGTRMRCSPRGPHCRLTNRVVCWCCLVIHR